MTLGEALDLWSAVKHLALMRIITLRKLPPPLERKLVAMAKARRWSLSQTVIRMLEERLLEEPPRLTGEQSSLPDPIDSLAGTWSPADAAAFDRGLSRTRQIDQELWE